MTKAYVAYEQLHQGDVILAVFWDGAAAYAFAKRENDAYEAEVVAIEEIALVDRYGFPCAVSEIEFVAPWIAAA